MQGSIKPREDQESASRPWTVRRANIADLEAIVQLNINHAQERGYPVNPDTVRAGVQVVLQDPGGRHGQYFVAVNDRQEVVGQAMMVLEWNEWDARFYANLTSIFTVPAARHQGVCTTLLQHLEDIARQTPAIMELRLHVRHNNTPALAAYLRAGFQHTGCLLLSKRLGQSPTLGPSRKGRKDKRGPALQ